MRTNRGLSVRYIESKPESDIDLEKLIHYALTEVIYSHPILSAVPVCRLDGTSFWTQLPWINLKDVVHEAERRCPRPDFDQCLDPELDEMLETQHNTNFKSGGGTLPVWRLVIMRDGKASRDFNASFIAHHAIADGTALKIFHVSFYKALCCAPSRSRLPKSDGILFSQPGTIPPRLEDIHPLPTPVRRSAPWAIYSLPREWRGRPAGLPCKTRYKSVSIPPEYMQYLAEACEERHVTPPAALVSLIAKLLYEYLPSTVACLTCSITVSLRNHLPADRILGEMGSYIDAFKVTLCRKDIGNSAACGNCKDMWTNARKVDRKIGEYIAFCSLGGQGYTNVAFLKDIRDIRKALTATLGDSRAESFELSYMGAFPQPAVAKSRETHAWRRGEVRPSRCAYASGGPLSVSFLSCEGNVGIGFTWQSDSIPDETAYMLASEVHDFFYSLMPEWGTSAPMSE